MANYLEILDEVNESIRERIMKVIKILVKVVKDYSEDISLIHPLFSGADIVRTLGEYDIIEILYYETDPSTGMLIVHLNAVSSDGNNHFLGTFPIHKYIFDQSFDIDNTLEKITLEVIKEDLILKSKELSSKLIKVNEKVSGLPTL